LTSEDRVQVPGRERTNTQERVREIQSRGPEPPVRRHTHEAPEMDKMGQFDTAPSEADVEMQKWRADRWRWDLEARKESRIETECLEALRIQQNEKARTEIDEMGQPGTAHSGANIDMQKETFYRTEPPGEAAGEVQIKKDYLEADLPLCMDLLGKLIRFSSLVK
jgi:hypothetical protein